MAPNSTSMFNFDGGGAGNDLAFLGSGAFNFGSLGGSNQYMNFPSMSGSNYMPQSSLNPLLYGGGAPPGVVPPQSGFNPSNSQTILQGWNQPAGGANKIPGGMRTGPTLDPVLTGDEASYLQSQIGQGVSPFDLSAILPSTGQTTTPGSLTAPMNPLMQALNQFYMGQSGVTGVPGSSSSPLNFILPMWQSEIGSMNIPIQEQLANLKEQFGSRGALGSSEMANAMQDYLSQTATGEQSLLGNLTLQALPGMQSEAGATQALDQSSIQNMLNEFIRTSPQNNPMNQYEYGMSTTFPPIYQPKSSSLLSSILPMIGNMAGAASAAGVGGTAGSILDVISALGA